MRYQRGNILFLILLAVVLFAALSYAVTSSLRGGGNDASQEKLETFAAQLIQTANLLENNMMRAMLTGNVPAHGFDLSGANTSTTINSTCATPACRMVAGHTNGSGPSAVALPPVPDWAQFTPGSTTYSFAMIRVLHIGTDAADLVMFVPNLNEALCRTINKALNVDSAALNTQLDGYNWSPDYASSRYNGTLTAMPSGYAILGDVFLAARGRSSYCLLNQGTYNFYHVLMAR